MGSLRGLMIQPAATANKVRCTHGVARCGQHISKRHLRAHGTCKTKTQAHAVLLHPAVEQQTHTCVVVRNLSCCISPHTVHNPVQAWLTGFNNSSTCCSIHKQLPMYSCAHPLATDTADYSAARLCTHTCSLRSSIVDPAHNCCSGACTITLSGPSSSA